MKLYTFTVPLSKNILINYKPIQNMLYIYKYFLGDGNRKDIYFILKTLRRN